MKIVQIANFYTPTSGGLRTCLDEVGRGYGKAGHERVLVVPGKDDADEDGESGRRITVRSPRLLGTGSYHVLTGLRMEPLLDRLAPDVLEVSDKFSVAWLAPWARRRSVPLVLFSHERIDAILRSRVPRPFPLAAAADIANRALSRRADQIVTASAFSAEEFRRIGAGNVVQVPLGVDLTTFRPNHRRSVDDTVRLVMVSRLSKEKAPELAVEALRVLVGRGIKVELTVIGEGTHRRRLERRSCGLPVRFLGHVGSRDEVAAHFANADIALCPSPVEAFGLAILEAMACGTPVVVPGTGAARELIGDEGSGVVTDGTATGLADGVQALLRVPVAQRRSDARAAAERFPWSLTVSTLLDLYRAYDTSVRAGCVSTASRSS